MPRNHNIAPRPHCKAIRYAGKESHHKRGDVCAETDLVEDGLCWLHRKVVEIRGVSVEKVLKGER